jgi:3-oxoacyl-[acyl-carrier protein] reductase
VVVFTYIGSAERALALVDEVVAAGGRAEAELADATDTARAQTLIDGIVSRHGRIDCVVNNAGITRDNLILRMTEQQWDEVMANNLKSAFNTTKAAAKHMMKQRTGSFINMSSVVGMGGNAGQANYAASKAGMIALTQSIAQELGSRGVRANAVAPGFIETEMTAALPEAELQKWKAGIPLGRGGTVEDVANACLFLASDMAAYVTGQTLRVDGGMR